MAVVKIWGDGKIAEILPAICKKFGFEKYVCARGDLRIGEFAGNPAARSGLLAYTGAMLEGPAPDILLVEGCAEEGSVSDSEKAQTIIADLESAKKIAGVKPGTQIITCGRSEKDTLSLSSAGADEWLAELRREIMDVGGKTVPECEIKLPMADSPAYMEEETSVLKALAALICAGALF